MTESTDGNEKPNGGLQPKLLLAVAVTASMLLLSIAFSSQLTARGIANATDNMNITGTAKLPQPNDPSKIVHAMSTNAIYEPSAGKSHVFSPDGLFPFFNKTFTCGDSLACGVSAGADAKFEGTFEQGNGHNLTGYTATYTSPITYGPQQMAGHTYKLILTDTIWNSTDAAMPTRQAEFARMVNNVGFDQIQHGASHVDRSDVPQLFDTAFLYGHAKVMDVTNGNNTMVAQNIFTHVMIAHVMNETSYYRSLRDDAKSPTMVFLFAINIPSGVDLPGKVPSLTPEQAQSFTPLPTDPALSAAPQFAYPVQIEHAGMTVSSPMSQSTTWPVDNPKQPLLFNFLIYKDTQVHLKSMSDMTPNPQEAKLTVKATSVDGKAKPDPRMYVTIRDMSGAVVKTGFAPLDFAGEMGKNYTVKAANFDDITFDHWDDMSTDMNRAVTLTSGNTTITAFYKVESMRGFTPMTFNAPAGHPHLTVEAKSIDGQKAVNVWTLVTLEGGSTNSTATYKVIVLDFKGGNKTFDHWEDGSTDRNRTVTITGDKTITASYKIG